MQLGRKGWNNVIIFSMLIMIFFLNGLHKNIGNDETQAQFQPLLPVQSFVLTLKFIDQKIDRIGTSWRTTTLQKNVPLSWQGSEQQLSELVYLWQNTALMTTITPDALDMNKPLSVATFELAGEPLPWVYLLFEANGQYYLFDKTSQRLLLLDLTTAKQLFPSFTFS
ncbi:hypothetical protein FHG08_06055 [Pseudoalteromonas sp. Scap03]|uniref:hypothetical protein n=1 Tax=unclassified Pseudoalteromonas TaxID=194690 RepID=UPI0015C1AB32|nr:MULTISPECIES: hypothetical protein [unclassified Pseudoalteromonas]NWL15292.1 hypothetical protein [Pseudoalteromonas sp. Scap03]QLE80444.1 hypothetical protein FLM54_02320 [Pseudoalteromonas sp. Scap25]QLE88387.1 hypothetical protein FLM47_02320 [Pseudoalteromonas sp. Scap06]